jgi:hypothetical protein
MTGSEAAEPPRDESHESNPMKHPTHKIQLMQTPGQATYFSRVRGTARTLWNRALEKTKPAVHHRGAEKSGKKTESSPVSRFSIFDFLCASVFLWLVFGFDKTNSWTGTSKNPWKLDVCVCNSLICKYHLFLKPRFSEVPG